MYIQKPFYLTLRNCTYRSAAKKPRQSRARMPWLLVERMRARRMPLAPFIPECDLSISLARMCFPLMAPLCVGGRVAKSIVTAGVGAHVGVPMCVWARLAYLVRALPTA